MQFRPSITSALISYSGFSHCFLTTVDIGISLPAIGQVWPVFAQQMLSWRTAVISLRYHLSATVIKFHHLLLYNSNWSIISTIVNIRPLYLLSPSTWYQWCSVIMLNLTSVIIIALNFKPSSISTTRSTEVPHLQIVDGSCSSVYVNWTRPCDIWILQINSCEPSFPERSIIY